MPTHGRSRNLKPQAASVTPPTESRGHAGHRFRFQQCDRDQAAVTVSESLIVPRPCTLAFPSQGPSVPQRRGHPQQASESAGEPPSQRRPACPSHCQRWLGSESQAQPEALRLGVGAFDLSLRPGSSVTAPPSRRPWPECQSQ